LRRDLQASLGASTPPTPTAVVESVADDDLLILLIAKTLQASFSSNAHDIESGKIRAMRTLMGAA
jgi:hypothetical protein